VLATLHYGLNPNGYLLLGSSRAPSIPWSVPHVERDVRLYQSTGHSPLHVLALPRLTGFPLGMDAGPRLTMPPKSVGALDSHRDALERAPRRASSSMTSTG